MITLPNTVTPTVIFTNQGKPYLVKRIDYSDSGVAYSLFCTAYNEVDEFENTTFYYPSRKLAYATTNKYLIDVAKMITNLSLTSEDVRKGLILSGNLHHFINEDYAARSTIVEYFIYLQYGLDVFVSMQDSEDDGIEYYITSAS